MLGTDVLLSVPTESTVVRAVIASVVAAVAVRMLLHGGLRVPRVRAVAVLVPMLALASIVAVSWDNLAMPVLMTGVDAVNALPIPVRGGFLRFAPLAWPLLLSAWALVAGVRAGMRILGLRRTRRAAARCFETPAGPDSERVAALVGQVARHMHLPAPAVALCDDWGGGATAVGIRRPVLVVDRALAADLDDEELEGLVAHELAHVRRRDNLIAMLVGIARDCAFFVPGARGVLRSLHAEREAAADQAAVGVTGKPGALASGLLKVLDRKRGAAAACAAFAPQGSVVNRVRLLVESPPAGGGVRTSTEAGLVAGALILAVVAGVALPGAVAGGPGQRDAVALLWAATSRTADDSGPAEATAFAVYRRNPPVDDSWGNGSPHAAARRQAAILNDDGQDLSQAILRSDQPLRDRGLGLTPRPRVRIATDLVREWRATPVVRAQGRLGLYWLHRLESVG